METIRIVVESSENSRVKIVVEKPQSLDELTEIISSHLSEDICLSEIHIFDTDFNLFLSTFSVDDVKDLSRFRIVKPSSGQHVPVSDQPVHEEQASVPCETESTHSVGDHIPWPKLFILPDFPTEVNAALKNASEEFNTTGALFTPERGLISKMLTPLANEVFKYDPWASRDRCEEVAKELVNKFPCLGDNIHSRNPHATWVFKLIYKLSNLRRQLSKLKLPEVCIKHKEQKNKTRRVSKGISNYNPCFDYTSATLEELQQKIIEECQKSRRNTHVVNELMAKTFSKRRHDIVKLRMPVKSMRENWPALFTTSQVGQDHFTLILFLVIIYFRLLKLRYPAPSGFRSTKLPSKRI